MKRKNNEFEVIGYYRSTNVFMVDPTKCAKDGNLPASIKTYGFGFIAVMAVLAVSAVPFIM